MLVTLLAMGDSKITAGAPMRRADLATHRRPNVSVNGTAG